ncbi:hypothetical protein DFS34DRAFT_394970 [Phlyctochytrium arcticum]|nr:hypothetical protein DFS34DRAFT_394970 [Phlyctochytrium arcticum]
MTFLRQLRPPHYPITPISSSSTTFRPPQRTASARTPPLSSSPKTSAFDALRRLVIPSSSPKGHNPFKTNSPKTSAKSPGPKMLVSPPASPTSCCECGKCLTGDAALMGQGPAPPISSCPAGANAPASTTRTASATLGRTKSRREGGSSLSGSSAWSIPSLTSSLSLDSSSSSPSSTSSTSTSYTPSDSGSKYIPKPSSATATPPLPSPSSSNMRILPSAFSRNKSRALESSSSTKSKTSPPVSSSSITTPPTSATISPTSPTGRSFDNRTSRSTVSFSSEVSYASPSYNEHDNEEEAGDYFGNPILANNIPQRPTLSTRPSFSSSSTRSSDSASRPDHQIYMDYWMRMLDDAATTVSQVEKQQKTSHQSPKDAESRRAELSKLQQQRDQMIARRTLSGQSIM